MTQKGQHPNRFRALLRNAGLSIREIHRETAIPESTLYYWAAGNGVIPKEDRTMLAKLIGCLPHDLAPKYDMLASGYEDNAPEWEREMLIKRRELLQLLSIAGSTFFTLDTDLDRIEVSIDKSMSVDDTLIHSLETINSHYWELFMIAVPKSSILEGVLGQLKMQIQFLKGICTPRIRQRLYTLASSTSQLAGEIFFDMHDHNVAQSCYVFAASSAKEAKTFDLWASALVRHSYLPIFEERYENAIPLLEQAEVLARRGDSTIPTRYWAAATYAEAEAGRGKLEACQNAFERAQGINGLTVLPPAWIRFDETRVPALQGACYVRMQRPDLADTLLQQALQQSAKTSRRHAMILSDLAFSALQQADIEKACMYAEKAIPLTTQSASGFLRNNMLKIHKKLAPFSAMEAVKRLENRMFALV